MSWTGKVGLEAMKKYLILSLTLVLLSSCTGFTETDMPISDNQTGEEIAGYALPDVIHVSITDENKDYQTRTYVDGKKVLWHKGDAVSEMQERIKAEFQHKSS